MNIPRMTTGDGCHHLWLLLHGPWLESCFNGTIANIKDRMDKTYGLPVSSFSYSLLQDALAGDW